MDETHLEHIGEDAVIVEDPESGIVHLCGDEVRENYKNQH
jgi:hypothetical protein